MILYTLHTHTLPHRACDYWVRVIFLRCVIVTMYSTTHTATITIGASSFCDWCMYTVNVKRVRTNTYTHVFILQQLRNISPFPFCRI